jgi:hypothetical protein
MTSSSEPAASQGLTKRGRLRRAVGILLHACAGISVALWAAMGLAFARGGWETIGFRSMGASWGFASAGQIDYGLIEVSTIHWWPESMVGPPRNAPPVVIDAWRKKPFQFWIRSGDFGVHCWPQMGVNFAGNETMSGRRLDVQAPYEGAFVVLLVLPSLMWVLLPLRRRGIRSIKPGGQRELQRFVVATDLTCVHCGYNLRTQESGGRCTECGAAIDDTLAAGGDLAKSPPAWLRRVALGCVLLFLCRVVLAVTLAFVFENSAQFAAIFVYAVLCAGMAMALYWTGIFLVTASEYPNMRGTIRRRANRLRVLAGVSVGFLAAGGGYRLMDALQAPRPFGWGVPVAVRWHLAPVLLLVSGWVAYCGCVAAEFYFYRNWPGGWETVS